jgi:hypothetical protein
MKTNGGPLILTQTTLIRVFFDDNTDTSVSRIFLLPASVLLDLGLATLVEAENIRLISVFTERPILATVQGSQIEAGFEPEKNPWIQQCAWHDQEQAFHGMEFLLEFTGANSHQSSEIIGPC